MNLVLAPRREFTMIQALRGLAALWVVLFHISRGKYVTGFTEPLPSWLRYIIFDYGSAGVSIFFVLSGFVISHSLSDKTVNARSFATFGLRRLLRLDPPYWISILLTLVTGELLGRLSGRGFVLPHCLIILGHVLYLQETLRLPEISVVYWTLTYEVQFYLVLASCWWLVTILQGQRLNWQSSYVLVFGPMAALAFVSAALAREWALHGLFINLWHGFFLGVLAYEAGVRKRFVTALIALATVTLIGATQTDVVFGTPCALTALLIALLAHTGQLDYYLKGRSWQFLGRISYSLYLVHVPTITVGFAVWARLVGRNFIADLVGLVLVSSVTVAAASAFWWAAERPTHALARRLFAPPYSPSASQ